MDAKLNELLMEVAVAIRRYHVTGLMNLLRDGANPVPVEGSMTIKGTPRPGVASLVTTQRDSDLRTILDVYYNLSSDESRLTEVLAHLERVPDSWIAAFLAIEQQRMAQSAYVRPPPPRPPEMPGRVYIPVMAAPTPHWETPAELNERARALRKAIVTGDPKHLPADMPELQPKDNSGKTTP